MPATRTPARFYAPLAIGAPAPLRALPVRLERMIHFVPPHVDKITAKIGDLAREVDVILGNLEDGIPSDRKADARAGFIRMATATDLGGTGLWLRINALNAPWALDDLLEIVPAVKDRLAVIMLPKVDGPWDIHYLDQLLAQLEARHGIAKPILIHAILETAEGVSNVEEIGGASPRLHGMSLGPADLAASRGMKTTRVGGGHPGYGVLGDTESATPQSPRAFHQQDLWHYTLARMIDACRRNGIAAFYGPFGDFGDPAACESQFRNAFLMGCSGAWTLHPSQIEIAKRVFSPDPTEVAFARRVIAAMPDGSGAAMIDGRMQDDATWKQAKIIVDLARMVATKDKDRAALYALRCRCTAAPGATARSLSPGRAAASLSPLMAPLRARMRAIAKAKFGIGQVVQHRIHSFRGVIFDVDPVFANTEEWWQSIPEDRRPRKDQPFYHLLAENTETEYIAYVSEQNLKPDDSRTPVRHSRVKELFSKRERGRYRARYLQLH